MGKRLLTVMLALGLASSGVRSLAAEAAEAAEARPAKHALLVGCTKYPNLAPGLQLRGPGNDVVLMRELLTHRFEFPDDRVVTLAEQEENSESYPTRKNIQREFRRLAEVVQPGDEVVILLAGHGSQQPDNDPDNPEDLEPDGLDEIFLPRDVGEWDGSRGRVANVISDDQIRQWLAAIQRAGASVWVIVDACHSGTMIRGDENEVPRQVLPEMLIPSEALTEARRRAPSLEERTRGGTAPLEVLDLPKQSGRMIALYAAQSAEPTVERLLPPDADDRKPYGLLTYTMNQVLTQASAPLTYRELAQRIHQQYVIWGRSYPTPLLEGAEKDREVLGKTVWESRSRILLTRDDLGALRINAGTLLGITSGSVLAVYPPAGGRDTTKPLGHVRVAQTTAFDSVVEPIAHAGMLAPDDLPDMARAELVFCDYGALRLRVAIDCGGASTDPGSEPQRRQLGRVLEQLAAAPGALIEVVDDLARAQWLLQIEKGRLYLLPAGGIVARGDKATQQPDAIAARYGGRPIDDNLANWLQRQLRVIARARGLLALARTEDGSILFGGEGLDLDVELVRYADERGQESEVVPWDNGRSLRERDIVGFRIHNRGIDAVDVTLLFVDSDLGITAFFPRPSAGGDSRLPPGKSIGTGRARVTAASGQEHMVVIAVRADVQKTNRIDFSCLEQSSLERARDPRSPPGALDSPLGQLLQNALYAEGATRGLDTATIDSHVVRVLSWQVEK